MPALLQVSGLNVCPSPLYVLLPLLTNTRPHIVHKIHDYLFQHSPKLPLEATSVQEVCIQSFMKRVYEAKAAA